MPDPQRSRRTLIPVTLLVGGLLGVGPFVPRTMAVASTAPASLEVPGLAGWLGLALAVAALACVAILRRLEARRALDARTLAPEPEVDAPRVVDPLVAALRGPAAYAPDDLDARLTASASSTSASPVRGDAGPLWIRRNAPPRTGDEWLEREWDDASGDDAVGRRVERPAGLAARH
jgi:hypothetical protein